jgi:hypothetical protein
MSGPACTFDEQATAVHGMPARLPSARLAAPADQAHGRLILRDWGAQAPAQGGPGGHDVFQELRFEMAEVAEVLVLETQARVYEEVALTKEALDRIETVTATLRRQEAEVVVEDAGVSRAARTEMPPTT